MYFIGSVIFLLIIGLVLIFSIGLPILAAILVYHDANKRRDCSPWLWALAAAFVPCYIGVIIYLVIRKDYPLKNGAGYYDYQYSSPDNRENCYDHQYEEENVDGADFHYTERKTFPTWAKALIIIVAVIVVICLIALAVSAVKAIAGFGVVYSNPYHYGF